MVERKQIKISGCVQGVGFRPYVYQLAGQLKLSGWVKNDGSGVTLEIQGKSTAQFISELLTNLPPMAKIDSIIATDLSVKSDDRSFAIIESQRGEVHTIISPDSAICDACLNELFDTKSRFYHYPFLNCTHCGPRLTITHELPYDRANTSMSVFSLCAECAKDYNNPNNRRYHAQPTACNHCGPKLSSSVEDMARKIQQGNIIAVKGIGGYQLICDGLNEAVIAKLRSRKQRKDKPLAMMVLNLASVKDFANCGEREAILLTSSHRPIVLLSKKSNFLPVNIAPDLAQIGIMLPYMPLHYLLFHALIGFPNGYRWLDEKSAIALIVTSANSRENPIVTSEEKAQEELIDIADDIVSYNRKIVTRVDDSVVRMINQTPCFIRRARGYVPTCIQLAQTVPTTVALGGYSKNTFCLTRGNEAFLSQHIGDLNNKAAREFFHESLHYWLKFLDIKPECIAHDMHPDFYTTSLANEFDIPTFAIQHHHAHLSAVAAEYQIQEPVLGLALDGHGYGLDGCIWGGELFLLNRTHMQRLHHLQALPLPGGDKAAREPWYMGASVLHLLDRNREIGHRFANQPSASLLANLLEKNINMPTTTSCGRLFDAAAALLSVHTQTQYESQAAMKLESLVTQPEIMQNGWIIGPDGLSLLPLLEQLLNLDPVTGANLFHGTLIAALTDLVMIWSRKMQINTLLFSGGCFLNKVLSEGLIENLSKAEIKIFLPKQAPPNDGGISLGQAWMGGLLCA